MKILLHTTAGKIPISKGYFLRNIMADHQDGDFSLIWDITINGVTKSSAEWYKEDFITAVCGKNRLMFRRNNLRLLAPTKTITKYQVVSPDGRILKEFDAIIRAFRWMDDTEDFLKGRQKRPYS